MARGRTLGGGLMAVLMAIVAALVAAAGRLGDGAVEGRGPLGRAEASARARALTDLGRLIFNDRSLSASGALACATCHDPAHAFGPADGDAVAVGGATMSRSGHRAVPSLMYLQAVPPFTEHYFAPDEDGDSSVDNGPTGGLTWDGRVDRGSRQSRLPLLSPVEMANATPSEVATKLARASYAPDLNLLFGSRWSADPGAALAAAGDALEAYLQDRETFYPYSSKFDDVLAGRATLSATEARGLAAFEDPQRGNCARCHISRPSPSGARPHFTDYGLIALGLPRNPAIPANADRSWFDLGLCGPDRADLAGRAGYCGRFMTPTLRNVATRAVFFHNGLVHTLRDAVAFYAERDVNPAKWYPRGRDGGIDAFNDLPEVYRRNVEMDPPFGRRPGSKPALSSQEIDDIVAFLGTLTDAASGDRAVTTRR